MSKRSKPFGELLKEAVHQIAQYEQKSLAAVQDELGYALNREGAQAIYHWRRGNVPETAVVEKLARMIVARSDLGKSWVRSFLTSADYLYTNQLCDELFGQGAPAPTLQAQPEPEWALPISKDYRQLIGRDEEIKRLMAVISDSSAKSIIGIDGMGGIGKSALAYEVAALAQSRGFFQRVIGLRGADEASTFGSTITFDLLLERLAQQLGISVTTSAQDRAAQVKLHLRRQPVLLVLDDLAVGSSPQQALLTKLQPLLGLSKVIATSRQRFQGDLFEVHLKGLTATHGRHFLRQEGRERCFDDSLTSATRHELEEIVAATGGAPQAMKLVVGQLNWLPLAYILENLRQVRLTENLSVDEYVDFYNAIYLPSWRLLSVPAQELLILLAIFPQNTGGNFAAIQAVSGLSTPELTSHLRELWRFSLVEMQRLPEMGLNENRYYLHALTRYFVKSDLLRRTVVDEQKKLDALAMISTARYTAYFFTYLGTYDKDYKRLDHESENIAEALQLASQTADADHLLSCINQFVPYLLVRGRHRHAEQLLEQVLRITSNITPMEELIRALVLQGQVLIKRGALVEARQILQHALAQAEQQENPLQIADVLQALAEVELNVSDYPIANSYLQRAFAYTEVQNDRKRMTQILGLSGRGACIAAEFAEADTFLHRSLALAYEAADVELTIPVLVQLSALSGMQAQFAEAEAFARDALTQAEAMNHPEWIAQSLKHVSGALIMRGALAEGESYAKRGLEIAQTIGHLELASALLNNLGVMIGDAGYLAEDVTKIEKALQYYIAGLEIVRAQGNRERMRSFLSNVTTTLVFLGRYSQAEPYIMEADQLTTLLASEWAIADTKIALGKLRVAQKKFAEAEEAFQLALDAANRTGMPEMQADALWGLAKVAEERKNFQHARKLGLESLQLMERIQFTTNAAMVRQWLAQLPTTH